jgi:hypothetical protein
VKGSGGTGGGTGKTGPNYKISASGLFFICFGILFLLDSIFSPLLSISVTWPLLLISAGISLLLMAQAFRISRRISLFIPGWYLILLGGIFFLFSTGIIQEDFIAIVRKWWPMIFVLSGVALLIADHIPSHKISGGNVETEELTDSDDGGLD